MGLFNLFGLLAAFVSVSALAADAPVPRSNVSVNVNPTTGYYTATNSTLRLPNGVFASPTSGAPPVVTKYSGGLQQTIPTGITIDAIKKSAPLPVVVRAKTQSVKNAASRCLKSGRCNVGLILAGEGLSRFFDGLDWVMGEGGKVQKKEVDLNLDHQPDLNSTVISDSWSTWEDHSSFPVRLSAATLLSKIRQSNNGQWIYLGCSNGGAVLAGIYGGSCYWQSSGEPLYSETYADVPPSELDAAVDSSYNPEPSDWPALTPELELDDVEITSAPTLQGEPKTVTVYDAEGNPQKVTVTNTWYDFSPKDNPSPSPSLDMKTREETETYENGVLTGTTTSESTAVGGSGGAPPADIDIPTDCEFMPTVCAFLEWYRDDDELEEPDLSVLLDDRDFTETYTISGGSKQCPPPYELALPFIGQTYYLSFDFACDFASKIYYFIMAAAYIFAAYITIGVARNG